MNEPKTNESEKLLRGLVNLVHEVVEHGTTAVQRVHTETARRPFEWLELVPGLTHPVRGVRAVHDEITSHSYEVVRLVNRAVNKTAVAVLDAYTQAASEPVASVDPPSP